MEGTEEDNKRLRHPDMEDVHGFFDRLEVSTHTRIAYLYKMKI